MKVGRSRFSTNIINFWLENWEILGKKEDTWPDIINEYAADYPYVPWGEFTAKSNLFTFFTELPVEMRRKIWMFALPPPRVVLLNISKEQIICCKLLTERPLFPGYYQSDDPRDSPLLRTCQESREIFFESYIQLQLLRSSINCSSFCSEGYQRNGNTQVIAPQKCRLLDFRRDTLVQHLPDMEYLQNFGAWFDLSKMQRLGLADCTIPRDVFKDAIPWILLRNSYPDLKELTIVLGMCDFDRFDRGETCLIEVDSIFEHPIIQRPYRDDLYRSNGPQWQSAAEQQQKLRTLEHKAKTLKDQCSEIIGEENFNFSKQTYFNISVLARKHESSRGQPLWLVPRNQSATIADARQWFFKHTKNTKFWTYNPADTITCLTSGWMS
jgi:hypothetical protein